MLHNLSYTALHETKSMSATQSFSIWLLQVLCLSGLLVFFLWLSLRPSTPTYTIIDFSIPNATSFNDSTTSSFVLEVSNDNRGGQIYYNDINLMLYFHDEGVGSTTWPSFRQGHQTSTSLQGGVNVARNAWEKVVKGVLINGTAELKVRVAAAVRYKIGVWTSRMHGMNVEGSLMLGKDDGKISPKGKKIKLRPSHKRWRWRFHA